MPVSKKPRGPKREDATGANPFTIAGKLLYDLYEAAKRRALGGPTMEETTRRARTGKARTRRGKGVIGRTVTGRYIMGDVSISPCDPAGSRAAERRRRQGAHLHQHPSVIERFKNHPTRAEIDAEIGKVEAA